MSLFLIRLGELTLKRGSRPVFEATLKRNIKEKLKHIPHQLKTYGGRYYLYIEQENTTLAVAKILARTFGIADFHPAQVVSLDMQQIEKVLDHIVLSFGPQVATFKLEAKRVNKSFALSSYEICRHLGEYVLKQYPHLSVDVHDPDWTIMVEIRENSYLYAKEKNRKSAGPGGLPVGTAGRGMLLLSGGIDSPVAGWMMAKRGLQLLAIHFHTPPYTGCESLQKVRELAQRLAAWNTAGKIVLFMVNFTPVQLKIRDCMDPRYTTLLARICMMQIAELIAEREDASVLITGEALSQVASQTLDSLNCTDQSTEMLVLRPLIGMDKQDIIRLAEHLESFEISVQSGTDCCSLFAPENPVIHPNKDKVQTILDEADLDFLLQEVADYAEKEVICLPECSTLLKE